HTPLFRSDVQDLRGRLGRTTKNVVDTGEPERLVNLSRKREAVGVRKQQLFSKKERRREQPGHRRALTELVDLVRAEVLLCPEALDQRRIALCQGVDSQ